MLTQSEERLRFAGSGNLAYTCRKCLETMDTPVIEMDDSYEDEDIISLDELVEQEEQGLYTMLDEEEGLS